MQAANIRQPAFGARRTNVTRSSSRRLTVQVHAEKVLIVNSKGGGHSFFGLHLAKNLLSKGHSVTIMNDGDEAKLAKKPPFSEYSKVSGLVAKWGNPSDPRTYPSGDFDVVYDNNGKDMETAQPLIDTFEGRVKHYIFVASAGAYKADSIEPMHVEHDTRKSSAGHVLVEKYLLKKNIPWTVFQPLYIYGPHTAKDCEQWFLDRIVRDRPVCIPAPGVQLTSITHVDDIVSMMAAVIGNKYAIKQSYNLCTDRYVTFTGIAKALAEALGKEAKIVLYDPEKVGTGAGNKAEGFPFRTVHFFATPDKAKFELGWSPRHTFLGDVKDLAAAYMASGRQNKDIDFSVDDKILRALGK